MKAFLLATVEAKECGREEVKLIVGGVNDYFEAGIEPLLEKTDVSFEDVSGYPCLEIVFIEDLENARKLF